MVDIFDKKVCLVNDIMNTCEGEKTFWHYMKEGLELDFVPLRHKEKTNDYDLIIQNSFWGRVNPNVPTITLLQDNYMSFYRIYGKGLENLRSQMHACKGTVKVTNSNYMALEYESFGKFHVIPLGVDHNIFKPMDKKVVRKKYSIPEDVEVRMWAGSHAVHKGFERLRLKDNYWILVFKDHLHKFDKDMPNVKQFCKIGNKQMAELYNCADVLVNVCDVEAEGLIFIESLMCGTSVDSHRTGILWDWIPNQYALNTGRQEAIGRGLTIEGMLAKWKKLIGDVLSGRTQPSK